MNENYIELRVESLFPDPLIQAGRPEICEGRWRPCRQCLKSLQPPYMRREHLCDEFVAIIPQARAFLQFPFCMSQTGHHDRMLLAEVADHVKGANLSSAIRRIGQPVANEEYVHGLY